MTPSQHLDDYNASMRKGLAEKLFFVPMLPREVSTIYDFGCADGSLLKRALVDMRWSRPRGCHGVGFDMDPRMIERARAERDWACTFTTSYTTFRAAAQQDRAMGRKTCLVFSSVIHEYLSQGATHGDLMDRIEEIDPDYVAIRDMARPNWIGRQFIGRSPLSKQDDDLQAMLKSGYTANVEQEANEDYFALDAEELLGAFLENGNTILHYRRYIPEAVQKGIYERHGEWVEEPTHVQLLVRRR